MEEYPNLGELNCVSAPFTGDEYLKVLGIVPGPLHGGVDAKGRATLTTADGLLVTALKNGQYTIVVTDKSRTSGFRLSGPNVHKQTSLRYRGTVTWTVNLVGPAAYSSTGRRTHAVFITMLP